MAELSETDVQRIRELIHVFYETGDAETANVLFGMFDRDGSGSLEADEIELIVTNVTGKPVEPGKIEAIIKAADSDGNSTIEPDEFVALLNEDAVKSLFLG